MTGPYKIVQNTDGTWIGLFDPDGNLLVQDDNLSVEQILRALHMEHEFAQVELPRGEEFARTWAATVQMFAPCVWCYPDRVHPEAPKKLCPDHQTLFETKAIPLSERYNVPLDLTWQIITDSIAGAKAGQ